MITKLSKVYLAEFNPKFRKSISGYGNTTIHPEGVYHTIMKDDKKVGIVGYIPRGPNNFEQVAILPKYRGLGLVNEASNLLLAKYKMKKLLAHIDNDNVASIGSHAKAGFKRDLAIENKLIASNKLPKNSMIYSKVRISS